jgi:hypothetical protein
VVRGLLNDIRSGVAGNLVWDVIKLIVQAILTYSVTTGGTTALASWFSVLEPYKWIIAISTGSIIVLFLISRHQKNYKRYSPAYPPLEFDFEVEELEITYEYQDMQHMTYSKRKKLKALRNGLDRYQDKYLWTGGDNVTLSSGVASQKVEKTERKNVWQNYEIRFPNMLNKGDVIDTCPVWTLIDNESKAVPFMSSTIEEPTKHLKIVLRLPKNVKVASVVKEISSGLGAKKPFSSIPDELKNDTVIWEEPDPKLLYHYELKWQWL